jgi:hypothetical protein
VPAKAAPAKSAKQAELDKLTAYRAAEAYEALLAAVPEGEPLSDIDLAELGVRAQDMGRDAAESEYHAKAERRPAGPTWQELTPAQREAAPRFYERLALTIADGGEFYSERRKGDVLASAAQFAGVSMTAARAIYAEAYAEDLITEIYAPDNRTIFPQLTEAGRQYLPAQSA